jgi:hypothetical protein
MVITKHFLSEKLGLDFEIAEFFADRKPPANNLYWHKKFLYLSFGTGYLIIPIIIDVLYKSGIDKKILLDPERIARMEEGFDVVAQHEVKRISFETHIEKLATLFNKTDANIHLIEDLLRYFNKQPTHRFALGTSVSALDRADAFIFTFADLPVDELSLKNLITRWYHVAATLLLLDDLVDLEDDVAKQEENAVIELGYNKKAMEQAQQILNSNMRALAEINPALVAFLQKIADSALNDEQVKKLWAAE